MDFIAVEAFFTVNGGKRLALRTMVLCVLIFEKLFKTKIADLSKIFDHAHLVIFAVILV